MSKLAGSHTAVRGRQFNSDVISTEPTLPDYNSVFQPVDDVEMAWMTLRSRAEPSATRFRPDTAECKRTIPHLAGVQLGNVCLCKWKQAYLAYYIATRIISVCDRSMDARQLTPPIPPAPMQPWQQYVIQGLISRYDNAYFDLEHCKRQQPPV